jgi:iron complex outermembrane recepter protein
MIRQCVVLSAFLGCSLPAAYSQERVPEPERLETITVTAGRFASVDSLKAISADIIDADDLSRISITRASDLSALSAALTVRSIFGSSAPQFFIRGIGSNDINPSANPGIAIYQDDAFIASPLGQNLDLFDLVSVAVLKGPQGTLFGRNATGGAIVTQTQSPGENAGGYAQVSIGERNFNGVEAGYDFGRYGPLALRISGMSRKSDGATNNTETGDRVNGLDEWGIRLRGDLKLPGPWNADMSIGWVADRSDMTAHKGLGLFAPESLSPGRAPQMCDLSRISTGTCVNILGYQYSSDPYEGAYDRPTQEMLNVGHGSLVISRDGPVRFKSVTTFRTADREVFEDADASPLSIANLDFLNQNEAVTQEFNFKGRINDVSWTSGLFFLGEQLETTNRYDNLGALRAAGVAFSQVDFFLGPFRLQQDYVQEVQSSALYGELDWRATEVLTLSAGLRYTIERTDFRTQTDFSEDLPDTTLSPRRAGMVEDDAVSWRFAGSWDFEANSSIFASASRSFRSSSFNGGALFPFDTLGPVQPEEVTALEIGMSKKWGTALNAKISAFQYNYDGLQDFTFRPTPPPTRQVLDSADAKINGIEASVAWSDQGSLSFDASLVLLDAYYTDFIDANGLDRAGAQLTAAPETALRLSGQKQWALSPSLDLMLSIDADQRSNMFFDSSNSALLSSPERTLVNARLMLSQAGKGWVFALEGSNLTDEIVLVDALNIAEYGLIQQTYNAPRQFFMSVTKSF